MIYSHHNFGLDTVNTFSTAFLDVASELENELIATKSDDDSNMYLITMSRNVLGYLVRYPDEFAQSCSYSVENFGEPLRRSLNDYRNSTYEEKSIRDLAGYLYIFLREFVFNNGSAQRELHDSYAAAFSFPNILNLSYQFIFAHYELPVKLVQKTMQRPELVKLIETPEAAIKINKAVEQWETGIKSRIEQQNGLEAKVDRIKSALNFVALDEGFNNLAEAKRKNLANTFNWLKWIGAAAVVLPLTEVLVLLFNLEKLDTHQALLIAPPLIAIELLLLYGFRVVLQQYKSLQAQLLQIDLRRSICQFIEAYAEHAKKIKDNSGVALDKFENMIFSGITSTDDQIPHAFDGLEKLIQAVRGGA